MALSVSNATREALTVWIEPWCDELTLPPKSVLALDTPAGTGGVADIEIVDDRMVVWAAAPGTMIVAIDGVEQDTGSRVIALTPEMFDLPVKTFVTTAFGGIPHARAAGTPLPAPARPQRMVRLSRWIKALWPAWIRFDRRG